LIMNESEALLAVANAITPRGVAPGHDAAGGRVESLTEAIMGLTAAMVRIAESIESVAQAVENSRLGN
jgi:hypothetical protein